MDEPTAALGVKETGQVLDLVRKLKADGRTVILISHTMRDVVALATRVVILSRGRKVVDRSIAGARRRRSVPPDHDGGGPAGRGGRGVSHLFEESRDEAEAAIAGMRQAALKARAAPRARGASAPHADDGGEGERSPA